MTRPLISSVLTRCVCTLGVLITLSGCQRPVTIDAANHNALDTSLQTLAKAAPTVDRKELADAVAYFNAAYFKGTPDERLPDWHAVQDMDRAEFLHFVSIMRSATAPAKSLPPDAPDPEVTRRFLETLQLEHDLLVERKDQAHSDGHYTVDQFDWAQPFFTPPAPTDSVLTSQATFMLNFTNRTEFNVYPPTLHLSIVDQDKGVPVFDEDLDYLPEETKKVSTNTMKPGIGWNHPDPIAPNSPTLLRYVCCQQLKRPVANKLMENLPKNAKFEYSMTAIQDYTEHDELDHTTYTMAENTALVSDDRCIADIKSRMKTWTPESAIPACREGHGED
ncbi:hypothetical protein IMW82_13235 [Rhodanobacter sp. B2A1Ga4]|uniref:DUF6694 family lipoprotein n=1 Tax=Rhodanobacter sp. B2A1Ga4 TaxID=2778647 RepID=UPI001B382E28|nr:DUF6694 family lipoprotein [Rhodanobacter sp. B2A1Ga4]MBQ4855635.1 hypothetical protein [Rhodanobacter sp. B2A1Ga4]